MITQNNISQKVHDLTVEDFVLSSAVFKMISPNAWRGSWRDGDDYTLKDGIEDRLAELEEVKDQHKNLRALVKEELQQAIKAHKDLKDIFRRCCAGEDPYKIISDKELAKFHVWGPFAEFQTYSELLYSEKYDIDASGGVEKYMQKKFVETVRQGMVENNKTGTERAEIMKLMLSICADPTFDEWDWLLDQIKHGHVALMSNAKAFFSHDAAAYVSGDGFNHPVLREEDSFHSSSRSRGGMRTSILAKIWPNGLMARSTSRFYLFPNGIEMNERMKEVLAIAAQDKRYDTIIKKLKTYESKGNNFGGAERLEYHNMATEFEELWKEHVGATSALTDLDVLRKKINHI
ncbi:MAG: hypothetical protein ACPG1C_09425 [Alphaproteobacteria bacterium]